MVSLFVALCVRAGIERKFPAVALQPQGTQGGAASSSVSFKQPKDPRRLRFLVIDSVSSSRRVIRRMLEQHMGHTVQEASDTNEASALLFAAVKRGTLFDAVIIDCTTPATNGLNTARIVRSTGGWV